MCLLLHSSIFMSCWALISCEFELSCPSWRDERFQLAWIDNKCYIVSRGIYNNWKEANKMCKDKGVDLLKHNVEKSVKLFLDYFDSMADADECYFTGLNHFMGDTDRFTDGLWQWADGELLYESTKLHSQNDVWARDGFYPDYLHESSDWDKNCGAICKSQPKWTTEAKACDSELGFICQYDPCPVWKDDVSQWSTIMGDNCYTFSYNKYEESWSESNKACADHGKELLKFTPQSNLNLTALMTQRSLLHLSWIGLSYHRTEGEWKWTDGTTQGVPPKSWQDGNVRYDCATLNLWETSEYIYTSDGYYSLYNGIAKADCNEPMFFICQHDVVPVNKDVSTQAIQTSRVGVAQERLATTPASMESTQLVSTTAGSTTIVNQQHYTTASGRNESTGVPIPQGSSSAREERCKSVKVFRMVMASGRLTSTPTATLKATKYTTCARMCQKRQPPCRVFDMNMRRFLCRCFQPSAVLKLGSEPTGEEWTIWEFTSVDVC